MTNTTTTAWNKVRQMVIARDEEHCVKCGRADDLQVHHIIPRDQQGTDAPDNLTTLCKPCHREWELLMVGNIPFQDWLLFLPMTHILRVLAQHELWRDDIPAAVMRSYFMSDATGLSEFASFVSAMKF